MNDSSIYLTPREREIASLIAGFTYAQIAELLSISLSTVKRHVENIYRKMGVHDRAKCALRWQEINGQSSRYTTSHSDRKLVARHSVSGPFHKGGFMYRVGDYVEHAGTVWIVAGGVTDPDGTLGIEIHHKDMPDFDTLEEERAFEAPSAIIRDFSEITLLPIQRRSGEPFSCEATW